MSAEPDFCRIPGTNVVEHDLCIVGGQGPDICYENGQNVVDICDPAGPIRTCPPMPSRSKTPISWRGHLLPVDLPRVEAISGLPMLGGVAAGAAVAWVLRRRMKHSQDKADAG